VGEDEDEKEKHYSKSKEKLNWILGLGTNSEFFFFFSFLYSLVFRLNCVVFCFEQIRGLFSFPSIFSEKPKCNSFSLYIFH
jgi:hypothetical protein